MKTHETPPVNHIGVAHDQTGQVYGQKAIAANQGGAPLNQQDQGEGEDRVKPIIFQLEFVNDINHAPEVTA
jgi:hypothetical protein